MNNDTPIDWLTDKNTFFLLGAGCSKCAGKPLMTDLTQQVLDGHSSSKLKNFFSSLKNELRDPNIEDLMNSLLSLERLALSMNDEKFSDWSVEEIQDCLVEIKKLIVQNIGSDWLASDQHKLFFERIAQIEKTDPTDIFCLNYDLIIEASLEAKGIPYLDGFRGANNAHFEPNTYSILDSSKYRLFKLHGSINWIRDQEGLVRRRPDRDIDQDASRAVIYPSEQKYVETKFGVYEVLIQKFRERLRESRKNNKLIISGYSFSDEHINHALEDGISNSSENLSVFAFLGSTNLTEQNEKSLQKMADNCKGRLNFFIGTDRYLGTSFSQQESQHILKHFGDLSRFENLTKLIT